MYPRTILSGMLTNVRPTAGGTVKQAFLHGRGGPRLMIRYGQAPQREISSLKLGATGHLRHGSAFSQYRAAVVPVRQKMRYR